MSRLPFPTSESLLRADYTVFSKIYAPAILPMLAVYCALTMEVMGDIVASSEASRQPVDGLLLDSRVAGGILADGFNGMLSALFTNAPLSIFAQNNGGEHLGAWD